MIRFVARRLILAVPTLLIVSVFVFGLQKLMPGDAAIALAGEERNTEIIEFIREKYRLNDPLPQQYWAWLSSAVAGDLGESMKLGSAVGPLIAQKLVVTLQLSLMAMVVALAIGIPAGILAAVRKGTVWDWLANIFALSGLSIPNFWLGILLILFFSIQLRWLPASGYVPIWEDPLASLAALIMPAFVLGTAIAGMLMRHTRSAMLEVLRADYIRTARAKGISERRVILIHGLRNALAPIVTFSSVIFGELLAGAVLTEQVFNIPGMGKLIVDSVYNRDYAVVQGVVLVSALIFLVVNLLADILNLLLNPKVQA